MTVGQKKLHQHLLEYGIHDLRNIARIVGVNAPTKLTKEKLITEVAAIFAVNKNSKYEARGRKPNKAVLLDRYGEVVSKLKNMSNGTAKDTAKQNETTELIAQSVLTIKHLLNTDDNMQVIIAVANVLKMKNK